MFEKRRGLQGAWKWPHSLVHNSLFLLFIISFSIQAQNKHYVETEIPEGFEEERYVLRTGDKKRLRYAMEGPLDFLRGDIYHQGQKAEHYRNWFNAHDAGTFGKSYNLGLFQNNYGTRPKDSPRNIRRESIGADYEDLSMLPSLGLKTHYDPHDLRNKVPSFLFLKAMGRAVYTMEYLQKLVNRDLGRSYKWVDRGPGGGKPYLRDPKLSRVLISPKKILDQVLLGVDVDFPLKEKEGEAAYSNAYYSMINTLLRDGVGVNHLQFDPRSRLKVSELQDNPENQKEYRFHQALLEEQLVDMVATKIVEELSYPIKDILEEREQKIESDRLKEASSSFEKLFQLVGAANEAKKAEDEGPEKVEGEAPEELVRQQELNVPQPLNGESFSQRPRSKALLAEAAEHLEEKPAEEEAAPVQRQDSGEPASLDEGEEPHAEAAEDGGEEPQEFNEKETFEANPDEFVQGLNQLEEDRAKTVSLHVCLASTFDELMGFVDPKNDTVDSILEKYHFYAESCWEQILPGKIKSPIEKQFKSEYILQNHIARQKIPEYKARMMDGDPMEPADQLVAQVLERIIRNTTDAPENMGLFAENDLEIRYNGHLPNQEAFETRFSDVGERLKGYGITLLWDECRRMQKVDNEYFKNGQDTRYSECPTFQFDSEKLFSEEGLKFFSDVDAVAAVYEFMSRHGESPSGRAQFKRLLLMLEIHRKKLHMEKLNAITRAGGEVKPEELNYYRHPILDTEKLYGLAYNIGIEICQNQPSFVQRSEKNDCHESKPDTQFIEDLNDVDHLSMTMVLMREKENSDRTFYDFDKDKFKKVVAVGGAQVGGTIFSIDRNSKIHTTDEIEYHRQVRHHIEQLSVKQNELIEAAEAASTTSNGIHTAFSSAVIGWHNAFNLGGEDIEPDPAILSEANHEFFTTYRSIMNDSSGHIEALDELGIRQLDRGIYDSKQVKREVPNEKGDKEEKTFIESDACHNQKLPPELTSPQDFESNDVHRARYLHMLTCYAQMIPDQMDLSIESSIKAMKDGAKNLAWTAATVVTLPVGGAAVNVAYRGIIIGGTKAVLTGIRSGRAAYGSAKLTQGMSSLGAMGHAGSQGSAAATMNLLSRTQGGISALRSASQPYGQALSSARQAFSLDKGIRVQAGVKALQSMEVPSVLGEGLKPMLLGMGMMKGFGAVTTGIGHIRGKLEGTPGGAYQNYLQLLVGTNGPKDIAFVMGMMVVGDGLALVTKNSILTRILAKHGERSPVFTKALQEMHLVRGAEKIKDLQVLHRWALEAGMKQEAQSLRHMMNLIRKVDANTTLAGNIAAEIPMTAGFYWHGAHEREKMNEPIQEQIEEMDARIKSSEEMGDTEAVAQYKAEKKKLEKKKDGWFEILTEVFFDGTMAYAFRNARPGDFGGATLMRAHEARQQRTVNYAINHPEAQKIQSDDQVAYRLPKSVVERMRVDLLDGEERFLDAMALNDPDELSHLPTNIQFRVIPDGQGNQLRPDGSMVIVPEKSKWLAFRFRDQVPARAKQYVQHILDRVTTPAQAQ